jgi:predicted ribosomally synthesized peptide with nif11-like leader
MAEGNILRFLAACAEHATLDQELAAAERTADAWVAIGKKAGFEFTADELHRLVESRSGRRVSREDVVPTLLAAATGLLSDQELDRVGGGAGGDLGSWSKADGLDVTWSSAALSTMLGRPRLSGA